MRTEQNKNTVFSSPVIRLRANQMFIVKKEYGQIFYATDEGRMYVDTIDGGRLYDPTIEVLQTESERLNVNPNSFKYSRFYVVETNILFRYENGSWTIERGRLERAVAQTYYPDGQLVRIYEDDVTGNGILGDGSVVVRDDNRTISGLISSDSYSLNIAALCGNQININPSSSRQGEGSLVLNANVFSSQQNNNSAMYNGDLYVYGTINKVSPANWDSRFRILSDVEMIDSESYLLAGCYIEVGSVLNSEQIKDRGVVITEDTVVTTGSLTKGTRLVKGSTVNGVSVEPPYIFDLSKTASVPDFQSITSEKLSISDKTLTVLEIRDVSLGSELYFDFSDYVFPGPFNEIIVNGKPFKLVGGKEVNSTQYALVKIINDYQFILIKEGEQQ